VAVRADARGQIISLSSARDLYGVVLEGEDLTVNLEQTAALRASRRGG
jgi:hypothetical protein